MIVRTFMLICSLNQSYDNRVKLFDTRKMTTPITEIEVGGGAWRVKWHPSISHKEELLVACMHDGFKVVRWSFDGSDLGAGIIDAPVVSSRFDAHTSLAYGADWQHRSLRDNDSKPVVASCSFYDHMLCMWSP
jgi:diphthamide biosynthesis protein 7